MGLNDVLNSKVQQFLRTPRNKWRLSETDLRDALLDYPEFQEIFLNRVPKNGYAKAICWAIIGHNSMFPYEAWTPENFFDPFLLRILAQIEILDIRRKHHALNYFTGSSGGMQVPIHEQWQQLAPLVQELKIEAKQIQIPHKRRLNNHSAFGKVPVLNPGGINGFRGF